MQDSSLELLLQRITSAEERVDKLYKAREFIDSVERVKQDLFSRRIYTAQFYTVPDDYYERSLEERAAMLGSRGVDQLCKTIIFENTVCDSDSCEDISYSKYYCVVVQYQGKVSAPLLFSSFMSSLNLRSKDQYYPASDFRA